MTLIIGRKSGNQILLASDTLLTPLVDQSLSFQRLTNCQIKLQIINGNVVVGGAGTDARIADAIQQLRHELLVERPHGKSDVQIVRECLEHHQQDSFNSSNQDWDVDFISAVADASSLMVFRYGKCRPTDRGYVGDQPAYNWYEKLRTSTPKSNYPNSTMEQRAISSASDAISSVIENPDFPGVGGFPVRVSIENGKFNYLSYASIFVNKMDASKMIPNGDGTFTMAFGNREDGDYGLEFIADNETYIPAVYFFHGRFGIIFPPSDSGTMEGQVSPKEITPREFESWCENQYDATIRSFHRGKESE